MVLAALAGTLDGDEDWGHMFHFKAVRENIRVHGLDYTLYLHLRRKLKRAGNLTEEDRTAAALRKVQGENARLKNRNQELQRSNTKRRLITELQIMLASAARVGDAEQTGVLEKLMVEICAAEAAEIHDKRREYSQEIKHAETKQTNKDLKALFIKKVLPEVYRQAAQSPMERKVVFMTPRSGLNESTRYIYERICNDTDYAVEFHEMKRIAAPTAEMYLRAIEMTRSMATAEAVFTHVFHDFFDCIDFRPETKVIQLWHGCGIIKTLGMTNAGKPGHRSVAEFEEYPEYRGYSLVTMPGDGERWIFADLMGIPEDSPVLQPIGVSRTDIFFEQGFREACREKLLKCLPQAEGKKIILYAPTYRGPDNARYAPDALDYSLLKEHLADQDYLLVVRHHGTIKELPHIPTEVCDFAYDMTRGSDMSINEWITVSDVIISDYSSVIYEFSLFERPIFLFQYDYGDYSKRGMYYTQDDLRRYVTVCNTNQELVDALSELETGFDSRGVRDFKETFMGACDGHATNRILELIREGCVSLPNGSRIALP